MARKRWNEGRTYTMTLDADLNRALEHYMHETGLSKPDATRQILWERLASSPELGARLAVQDRAFFQARRQVLTRAAECLTNIVHELRADLLETEKMEGLNANNSR